MTLLYSYSFVCVCVPAEDNAQIVTGEKGLHDVVNAMNTHFNHSELVESACAALLSLSIEGQYLIKVIPENYERGVTGLNFLTPPHPKLK